MIYNFSGTVMNQFMEILLTTVNKQAMQESPRSAAEINNAAFQRLFDSMKNLNEMGNDSAKEMDAAVKMGRADLLESIVNKYADRLKPKDFVEFSKYVALENWETAKQVIRSDFV